MKTKYILGLWLSALLLVSCSSKTIQSQKTDAPSATPTATVSKSAESTKGLTREMALTRARQVARVSYSLWFGLGYEHDDFDGRTILNFDLKPKASDASNTLLVDFLEGTLKSVSLNGLAQTDEWIRERYDGSHLRLKLSELNTGSNRVEIGFLQKYSKSGNGLHKFVDPEDKNIYLYSNLEPYNARRVFPCFDQPDLKASFEVTAEVPAEWTVVSNVPQREVLKVGPRRSWAFPPSPLFSTYLFALIAGPFSEFKHDAEGIPVRVLSRKSLKSYVDSSDLFQTTDKGLAFYSQEFGYAYPFPKLDLIFVPEFNESGMENVGAITLSERNIFRSRASSIELTGRRSLILHEIAHMWFGNLVTMRWWNGLWLNESFATFAAALAMEKTGLSPFAWEQFLSSMKLWAYQEDRLSTTHPIEMSVPDTDHAFANFDGITYGKGASVLKQLRFYLGEDDFREGMVRYFQKFSYRNATLTDLMRSLAEASGANLIQWQQQWLQSAGMNRLTPEFTCDPELGTITAFKIRQENLPFSTVLRTHKVRVSFYEPDSKGQYVAGKKTSWDVTIQKDVTDLTALVKQKCPAFVMINDDDYAFASIRLDAKSLEFATQNIHRFTNPLTRLNLTLILWDMMLDGAYSPKAFSEMLLKALEKEKYPILLRRFQNWAFRKSPRYETVSQFLSPNAAFRAQLEKIALARLQQVDLDFNLKSLWFKSFLEVAHSKEAGEKIEKWLSGKAKIPGFAIEKDRRWDLIETLAQTGASTAAGWIERESATDASQFGKESALSARALDPSPENKKQTWTQILESKDLNPNQKQTLLAGLWVVGAPVPDLKLVVEQYEKEVEKLNQSAQSDMENYIESFVGMAYPMQCTEESAKKLGKMADSISKIRPIIKKELLTMEAEESRCVRLKKTTP